MSKYKTPPTGSVPYTSERMSAIMASTFASFEEQLKGINDTIEVIDSGDYVNNSKGANE